jgi:hypothetical protein
VLLSRRLAVLLALAVMMVPLFGTAALAQAQGGGGSCGTCGFGGSDAGSGGGHHIKFEATFLGQPSAVNVGSGGGGSTVSGKGGGGGGDCTTFLGVTQCSGQGGGFSF